MNLSWKARTHAELALMAELTPPGSADVLVGIAPAQADEDVGAPSTHP